MGVGRRVGGEKDFGEIPAARNTPLKPKAGLNGAPSFLTCADQAGEDQVK
jgi:hypothetical protein